MVSTKIEISHSRIARTEDIDELAALLFPGNKNHQRIFAAVFVELKWSDGQFLFVLEPVADKYDLSRRVLETVRAKMRRMGLIDHVSRFNKRYGYREGWVFSNKFSNALNQLADLPTRLREKRNPNQEAKDRDAMGYL
ncbi:hypothetical protein FJY63_10370 [Candidatus Sumerlaeota bacterium]|nr:hypothetical protein [Candidatus Sumerlaeota bacterium]